MSSWCHCGLQRQLSVSWVQEITGLPGDGSSAVCSELAVCLTPRGVKWVAWVSQWCRRVACRAVNVQCWQDEGNGEASVCERDGDFDEKG